MTYEAPAITIVNTILVKAVTLRASDIHLEITRMLLRVRFRIDGLLYEEEFIEIDYGLQVISRIKVLAHMNVAERRIPQDGKFTTIVNNNEINLRVATFPSVYGEKVVIRILDRAQQALFLNSLGFEAAMLDQVKKLACNSYGFFLTTGPTGSGKTTTLHAMLSSICSPSKNIVTLEDPIEYHIDGITQGQIYPEIGFTFQRGIRAILRQDPDVIMVGEIRDCETAQVAIQAALTGHLVLSTLHTTDAPGALMRLIDMGIEPFLINAALTGILAQRLARKLCTSCRYESKVSDEEKRIIERLNLSLDILYKSLGCNECGHTGYKGRIGIFELLIVSSDLRMLITQHPVIDTIYAQTYTDGMKPLLYDAGLKVAKGIISLSELQRIIL